VKFIVDAQLPKSLSDFLNQMGYDSIHTLELPDKNRTKDSQIAKLANEEERIVISKDVDFLESFMIKSEPRKLIIVKTGNILNRQLIKIFEENLEVLIRMISRSNLIEVSKTEIVEQM
jgi:predicted nuclease of predicted toxin-antitoxin system